MGDNTYTHTRTHCCTLYPEPPPLPTLRYPLHFTWKSRRQRVCVHAPVCVRVCVSQRRHTHSHLNPEQKYISQITQALHTNARVRLHTHTHKTHTTRTYRSITAFGGLTLTLVGVCVHVCARACVRVTTYSAYACEPRAELTHRHRHTRPRAHTHHTRRALWILLLLRTPSLSRARTHTRTPTGLSGSLDCFRLHFLRS